MHGTMAMDADDRRFFDTLDARLRTLLPVEYRDSYESVQPRAMRSAGLKYDADGQVAWDQIWGSFCDLAMAGGPPHKGALLEPGGESEIEPQFGRYDAVVAEICRGIGLATGLRAYASPTVGWVCVTCGDEAMAGWLVRAITMENVAVRRRGAVIELPAAPHFRLEKEIKNVVTVIAKTCHYWVGHIPDAQRQEIAELLARMIEESPFVEPDSWRRNARSTDRAAASALAGSIHRDTGLRRSNHPYAGWVGVECASVGSAVWMMRAHVGVKRQRFSCR
jgi:sirohydrochlorin cobaltochelatase